MSKIDGYVVRVGVYVEQSFYITDADEEIAQEIAVDKFTSLVEGLEYPSEDVEILSVTPEYHEEDE
jgi:hypothetical protein